MREVEIKVEGMHCTGCSSRLEKVLNQLDGVQTANVSLENKFASVKFDENKISFEELLNAIEDAGFKGE